MSHLDTITDLIDDALAGHDLQRTTEASYGDDFGPGVCWRCRADADSTSGLCDGCRAYLLEDSDEDPARATGWKPDRFPNRDPMSPIPSLVADWDDIGYLVQDMEVHSGPAGLREVDLAVSYLGDCGRGFLGGKPIRPSDLAIQYFDRDPDPSRFDWPDGRDTSRRSAMITIDGAEYNVVPDGEGVFCRLQDRQCGDRHFRRLYARLARRYPA
jgi:hypothetical protein